MDVIQEVGAYAGFAAVVGLAVLAALFFSQARDLRRLREWAGRAPERAAEQAGQEAPAPQPAPSAVRPIPAAKPAPAAAAQAGAKPATAAQPATAAKPAAPAKPGAPVPPGKPAQAPGAPVPATAAASAGQSAEGKSEAVKPAAAAAAATKAGKPAPATAAGAQPTAKPATAAATPASKEEGPAQAPAAGAKAPSAPAPGPPPAGAPRPPALPARPPGVPARPAPVGRTPATATASQSTAVLPASARVRDIGRSGPQRRRLDARYIALIVAGVVVLGAAAAFGVSQLGGDDEAPSSGDRASREDTPAGPLNRSLVTVSVLNGTTVPGLAAQIGDEIESKGFQRGNVANAIDQQRTESVVMFTEGAERPARVVARDLGISTVEQVDPDSQALAGNASVVVIVGADQTQ